MPSEPRLFTIEIILPICGGWSGAADIPWRLARLRKRQHRVYSDFLKDSRWGLSDLLVAREWLIYEPPVDAMRILPISTQVIKRENPSISESVEPLTG